MCYIATGADKKGKSSESALFLHVAGSEAREIFNSFQADDNEDKERIQVWIKKSTAYCAAPRNVTYESHTFGTRIHNEGEGRDANI